METSSGSYSPGTSERAIVDRFIADKSPGDPPDSGSYVVVELLPYAGLDQRPVDLVLTDAGLSAFVSAMNDGAAWARCLDRHRCHSGRHR